MLKYSYKYNYNYINIHIRISVIIQEYLLFASTWYKYKTRMHTIIRVFILEYTYNYMSSYTVIETF